MVVEWMSLFPAIGADGTIYLGRREQISYAGIPDGTQKVGILQTWR